MPTVDNSDAKSAPSRMGKGSKTRALFHKRIGVASGKFAVPEVIDEADAAVAAMFNASEPTEIEALSSDIHKTPGSPRSRG